jgi:hypothetical protein
VHEVDDVSLDEWDYDDASITELLDSIYNETGKIPVFKNLYILAAGKMNVRLLLLSATPVYNSYKEIIWIANLLNVNDKRPKIRTKDVIDESGNFKINDAPGEDGSSILQRKRTGYVSYVKGENP